MKCPKCQYISFDSGDRCRNCGYEFSFNPATPEADLPLRTGDEPVGPFSDFSLDEVDGLSQGSREASAPPAPVPGRTAASPELPLFGSRVDDDAPLVSLPAAPRPPVAVRKSSPAVRPSGVRPPAVHEPELDFPEETPPARSAYVEAPMRDSVAHADEVSEPAPAGPRLLAAAIDGSLMLAVDAAVLYFTLKVAGLELAEVGVIPVFPFAGFIALLNGGYMAGLTAAGGQSIGKMAVGIKVVTADPDAWTDRVSFGQAVLRSAGYLLSALPLGLGFLPALIGTDRRAVHDRLAHTRVVKA